MGTVLELVVEVGGRAEAGERKVGPEAEDAAEVDADDEAPRG